jgi:hypothetical protein
MNELICGVVKVAEYLNELKIKADEIKDKTSPEYLKIVKQFQNRMTSLSNVKNDIDAIWDTHYSFFRNITK